MGEKPLISIIVPVYNTSEFLSRCLDSILNQTYKNIEIIIIDDGSTDNSLRIIKKYAKRNSAIKYFTQDNCGQATARNKGIKYASGEYIMFVDSDDYVSNDFCEVAYNSIHNNHSEITFFDMYAGRNNSFQKITFNLNEGYVSKEDALATAIDSSFPVNKIYKLSLFNNINYPEGVKYEDLYTTYKLINAAQRVSYVKKALYYYVQRSNSTVHHFTTQSMTDYFNANQQLFIFFKENYPKLSKKMIRSVLQGSLYFLAYADKNSDQQVIKQARKNLSELPLPKSLSMKWLLILQLYKAFPQFTLNLFRKKVLSK